MSVGDLVSWPWGKNTVNKAKKGLQRVAQDNPFGQLQRQVNSLFEDFFSEWDVPGVGELSSKLGDFNPQVDLKEDEKAITLRAELPGLEEKDIELVLSSDAEAIILRGEKKHQLQQEDKDGRSHYECAYGRFQRQIPLPCKVLEDQIKASFKNGVLTVTMPKSESEQPARKRISISAG
jgi:HSP20 family protein